MKSIIPTLVAVLLVGCDSVEPYAPDDEKESTLRCIRRASWEPLAQDKRGKFPLSPGGLVLLKNETGQPLVYDFMPWWGDMDNHPVSPTTGIPSVEIPATYIPDGETAGVRIMEPVFFRDGALLVLWSKSANQEDPGFFTAFDSLRIQRITGEQMRNQQLTVTIQPGSTIKILPTE